MKSYKKHKNVNDLQECEVEACSECGEALTEADLLHGIGFGLEETIKDLQINIAILLNIKNHQKMLQEMLNKGKSH